MLLPNCGRPKGKEMDEFRNELSRASERLFGVENVAESAVDAIIRITFGATYVPREGEVIARVIRNHRTPYLAKTVGHGTIVYADPGNTRGILEGDFVAVRHFGNITKETPYLTGIVTRVYR